MRLKGHVAIVTGAGGVIGGATALRLAKEGAAVAVSDISIERAQKVADEAKSFGVEAMAVATDVRSAEQIERMTAAVLGRFGQIDILVNSAGGSSRDRAAFLHQSEEEVLDWVLDVNLKGVLLCIRAVLGPMIERRKGKIINIGSIVGVQGKAKHVEYAAAKGGVIAMTKALAMEVGPHGIHVNCVSPGLVPRSAVDEKFGARNSYIGEVCKPEYVADLVMFLASDEARFITGQNYIIDGGRSLGLKGD